MYDVILSLGSNLGGKSQNINNAVSLLSSNYFIHIQKISSQLKTEPLFVQGCVMDYFVNQSVLVKTPLKPYDLLSITEKTESILGKQKLFTWGPRIIDIDICWYSDITVKDDKLTLPHKGFLERGFMLNPALELGWRFDMLVC